MVLEYLHCFAELGHPPAALDVLGLGRPEAALDVLGLGPALAALDVLGLGRPEAVAQAVSDHPESTSKVR